MAEISSLHLQSCRRTGMLPY